MKKLFASVLAVAMVLAMPGKMSRAESKDKSTAQVEQTVVTEPHKTEETITKTAISSKDEGLIKKVWNAIKNNIKNTSWKTTIFASSVCLICFLVSKYFTNKYYSEWENALLKKAGCEADDLWCFLSAGNKERLSKKCHGHWSKYQFFAESATIGCVARMLIKCLI